MFRSGIELEYQIGNFWKISVAYDHRSSGDIWKYNPGLETVRFSLSKNSIAKYGMLSQIDRYINLLTLYKFFCL